MIAESVDRRFRIASMKAFFAGVLLLLLATPPFASASVHQIGPDLYAYISENDSSANSTFLVTEEGILVVDTGLNKVEGGKLLAEIRKISPAPVRYVVNTHYHPDHRGGNTVVGPEAVVISTEFTRTQTMAKGASSSSIGKVGANWITFPRALKLYLGGHEIRIYFPGPAHTLGDAVVYFPDEKAIATGDLFLTNSCPAMDKGDLENWIKALDAILDLPVERIVPGHFELAGKTELRAFRDYLDTLRSQVLEMYRAGRTLEQVQKGLKLEKYRGLRQFPQYEATFSDNAAAYFHQLKGREKYPHH
jgi:glyoxylase-like metal-dependent hydrolase (beta-lactamase superfamily II)